MVQSGSVAEAAATPASRELARGIGLWSAVLVVAGGTIGSGIFFTPAEVARALPSGTAVLLVWALGCAVALTGALTFAELGAMMPKAGGAYVYIREAFGDLPAFLFGWMALSSIATGVIAAVALGFAGYAAHLIDLAPVGGKSTLAVAVIAAITATNYFGLKPGIVVQNLLTSLKLGTLLLLILLGAALWTRFSATVVTPSPPPELTPGGVAAAFVPVLFTIGGFQQVNMVAGEIKAPQRVIPRALAIGIGIVILCYLGVNGVYLHVLGRAGVADSSAIAADAASTLIGPRGALVATVGTLVSMLGLAHVVVFAFPRVLFAMARDRAFFSIAARVHPRFGSPHVAVLVIGAWAIALLLAAGGNILSILSGVVFADWIFFGLAAASVFVLRRKRPDAARPYRVVGYPLVPAFFIAAALVGLAASILASPKASALGALLLAAGGIVFFARRSAMKEVMPS